MALAAAPQRPRLLRNGVGCRAAAPSTASQWRWLPRRSALDCFATAVGCRAAAVDERTVAEMDDVSHAVGPGQPDDASRVLVERGSRPAVVAECCFAREAKRSA